MKPMQNHATLRNGSQPGRQDTKDSSIKTPNSNQLTKRPAAKFIKLYLIAKHTGNTRKMTASTHASLLILTATPIAQYLFLSFSHGDEAHRGGVETQPLVASVSGSGIA
jgi:hypothetical protein